MAEKPENKFKDTLNLPTTDFPIRSNAGVDDPAMIEGWIKEDLCNKACAQNNGFESSFCMMARVIQMGIFILAMPIIKH